MSRSARTLTVALALGLTGSVLAGTPEIARRKPVALASDGRRLFVANAGTGSVSVVDVERRSVVGEAKVGRSVVDVALTPDGRRLLAVDAAAGELIVLDVDGPRLGVSGRLAVAADPASVSVAPDGRSAVVASKWSRRLTFVGLGPLSLTREVVLPFPARRQLRLDGRGKLVAADAFGGGLAVVDLASGAVESRRTLPAHNVGGLAVSEDGERLVLTQQYLNARADTRADDIHWGFLMTNSLRSVRLDALLTPGADVVPGGRLDHLGEPGRGAGDPSGVVVLPGGRVATALSGVNEIAVGPVERPDRDRVAVGRRPTALLADAGGKVVYAAETLDDALAFVDVDALKTIARVGLGPTPAPTEADLGERLFYDATLSHEGWMSCQSCHGDGHASALLADTLGDGSYGAPKRTLSLLGVADTAPYAWDGSVSTLEGQVRKSFRTTLQGKDPGEARAREVAAFLRTLAPPPADTPADPKAVERGRLAFGRRGCDRCHAPPTYTTAKTYDVGLTDDVGNAAFNPPSLRGVGRRDRLFHDGRARGLDEVLTRFGHPNGRDLPAGEAADLAAFLRSL